MALGLSVACAIAALAAPAPANAATTPTVDTVEQAMLSHINNLRASKGLVRLRLDAKLVRASTWHSNSMATYNYFSHTDHLGRSPYRRMSYYGYWTAIQGGENIAAGYPDALQTYNQWLNSPGHKANMLYSTYRAIGIARVCRSTAKYNCYWTTKFGKRVTESVVLG